MKFVEIVDSDESAHEELSVSVPEHEIRVPFAGGIAERAKERTRSAKSVKNAELRDEMSSASMPQSKVVRHDGKRNKSILDQDDGASERLSQHAKTAKAKRVKKKSKEDRRKALARYEASDAEVDNSPPRNDLRSSVSYEPATGETGAQRTRQTSSHVQPTPGLPTPLSIPEIATKEGMEMPQAAHTPGIMTTYSHVTDSQSSPISSSVVPTSRRRGASQQVLQPIHIADEDEDELATSLGSEKRLQRRSKVVVSDAEDDAMYENQGNPSPIGAVTKHVLDMPAIDVKKTIGKQKRGRERAQDQASANEPRATEEFSPETQGSSNVAVPEKELQVPLTDKSLPALIDDDKSSSLMSTTLQVPATTEDVPESIVPKNTNKVVNYAANGKSLSIKSSGPRYRVGLSKRIKVDSLHQNIVRKYP